MVSRRLHGFTAVAELKHLNIYRFVPVYWSLHGFTAVAELKHFRPSDGEAAGGVSTASPPWPN